MRSHREKAWKILRGVDPERTEGSVAAIEARHAHLSELTGLRQEYRDAARCQIVHDSILPRGLADPFVVSVDGEVVGYAGVWNKHFPGRLLELHIRPAWRHVEPAIVGALRRASGAMELEAQTNIPGAEALLERFASTAWTEKLLFRAGGSTDLAAPGVRFRARRQEDRGPEGEWVVEAGGEILGAGGILTHYNPPYGDLYMEVVESARRRGIGSYLIQELRRVCAERGLEAAARCNPDNVASRRTLERGGMVLCGALRAGALEG